jgi:hypothetical protein
VLHGKTPGSWPMKGVGGLPGSDGASRRGGERPEPGQWRQLATAKLFTFAALSGVIRTQSTDCFSG